MIFIDTGAFIARFVSADQHHAQAVPLWKRIEQTRPVCVTSNLVISETLTYLGRHVNYGLAAQGLHYFEKYSDQEVSFTDCVSFALMHKRKIHQAFTFDRHFILAGFESYR